MALIQFKRASLEYLQASETIFAAGEPIFEKDTGKLKIGDGINKYADLKYVGEDLSFDLSDYYTKEETDQKLVEAAASIQTFTYKVIDALPGSAPTEDDLFIIYLVNKAVLNGDPYGAVDDVYNEFIAIKHEDGTLNWEYIGDTKVSLNEYYDKEEIDELLSGTVTEAVLSEYAKKSDIEDSITEDDLTDYAKVSDLDNYVDKESAEDFAKKSDLNSYVKTVNGIIPDDNGNVTLEFAEQHKFIELELEDGKNDTDLLDTIVNPSNGDYAVIIDSISDDAKQRTAYVYTDKWEALDGNYSAENVYFKDDLIYTANIGVKTVPASGYGTITAAGKNVKDVFSSILAEEKNPTITQPTAKIESSNISSKEVGDPVAIKYSVVTTEGKYEFDSSTDVMFNNFEIKFNGETKTTKTGTFTQIVVDDDTNLTITGSCKSSEGSIPHTNLGNDYVDGQITEKEYSLSLGTLTGYRKYFYGYKTADTKIENPEEITSQQIRNLGNSGQKSFSSKDMTASKMQQIFVAIPHTEGKTAVEIKNSATQAPQTVTGPISIDVEGANNYTAAAYDVWYVDNAAPDSGSNKYTITAK